MNPKYREAPWVRRIPAKMVDFFFVPTVSGSAISLSSFPLPPALTVISAGLLMYLYLLLADGFKGQSVGKRLFGLKVVNYQTGSPCTFFESFVRNIGFFGLARIWQIAEEEHGMQVGNYKGTIVIDVREFKTSAASETPPEPPKPAKLDLEGIANFARRKKDPES